MGTTLHPRWRAACSLALFLTFTLTAAVSPSTEATRYQTRFFHTGTGVFHSTGVPGWKNLAETEGDYAMLFKDFGIEFPPGTGAAYEELSGLCVVTHTPEVLEKFARVVTRCADIAPQVEIELRFVRMDASTFGDLMKGMLSNSVVSTSLLQRIGDLEKSDRAVLVEQIMDHATSGESSAQLHTAGFTRIADYTVKDRLAHLKHVMLETGFTLNYKPVVSSDRSTVNMTLTWERVVPVQTASQMEVRLPGFEKSVGLQSTATRKSNGSTSLVIRDGQTILIATLRASTDIAEGQTKHPQWICVLFTAKIAPVRYP